MDLIKLTILFRLCQGFYTDVSLAHKGASYYLPHRGRWIGQGEGLSYRGSAVYFLSDTHIRGGSETERFREERLVSFLCHIMGRAEALYILGDLFDFWFEYRSVIPRTGGRVLYALHHLVSSGTPVICISGNHDFWLGSYISDEMGIRIARRPLWVRHQGMRIFMAHGDEFFRDLGYLALRYALRHPLSIRLFRLIHPDLGALLAEALSQASRSISPAKFRKVREELLRTAEEKFREGADVVAFGHLHVPMLRRCGGHTLVVLGDWIRNFTYAVLEDGEVSLRRWEPSS